MMKPERAYELEHASDEAQVRELNQKLINGWNQGDGEAFAAAFAEHGDLIGFDGTHLKGRKEIASFQQELFDKWLKGTRLIGRVTSVRFINSDTALMHPIGGTVMRGRTRLSPERDSIQTLVAVKRNGEWRLAAFQNTRVRVMSKNFRSVLIWLFTDWLWKWFASGSGSAAK